MQLNLVGAKTGYLWFRQGIWLFRRNPIGLLLLTLTATFALIVLSLIPILGSVAFFVLLPSISVAFMMACRDVVLGKPINLAVLVAPLHQYGPRVAKSLLLLGALGACTWALLFELVNWIGDGAFLELALSDPSNGQAVLAGANLGLPLAVLWLGAIPIMMLFWHAPVLIAWHEVAPVKAMFFSFVTCLRNWGALLVLVVIWLAVGLLAMLTLGFVVTALDLDLQIMSAGAMPLATLWLTALLCSMYATYRGSFRVPDERGPSGPEARP